MKGIILKNWITTGYETSEEETLKMRRKCKYLTKNIIYNSEKRKKDIKNSL